jgi:hypothetical protein
MLHLRRILNSQNDSRCRDIGVNIPFLAAAQRSNVFAGDKSRAKAVAVTNRSKERCFMMATEKEWCRALFVLNIGVEAALYMHSSILTLADRKLFGSITCFIHESKCRRD